MPDARGEGGQMMLLSAVLLILAFLALSAMVARVSQLGSATTQDQERPLLAEIDVVHDTIDRLVVDLKPRAGTPLPAVAYDHSLNQSLSHLAFLEGARGFKLEWSFSPCLGSGTDTGRRIDFALSDGEIRIALRSSASFVTLGCRPGP